MTKKENLENPDSCLNRAADDEPIFVLRAKDVLAPRLVACWCQQAMEQDIYPYKIASALRIAAAMIDWRTLHEQ